jgi:hypothetical protein
MKTITAYKFVDNKTIELTFEDDCITSFENYDITSDEFSLFLVKCENSLTNDSIITSSIGFEVNLDYKIAQELVLDVDKRKRNIVNDFLNANRRVDFADELDS